MSEDPAEYSTAATPEYCQQEAERWIDAQLVALEPNRLAFFAFRVWSGRLLPGASPRPRPLPLPPTA